MTNRSILHKGKAVWIVKVLFVLFTFNFSLLTSFSQGIPFLRNYSAQDYHAHSRNFDVEVGQDGFIFIANFEGLMYFDRAEWHTIHTPGITRVTVVFRDKNNTIWAGGYNYFGKIHRKKNGELYLKQVGDPGLFRGEVLEIYETKKGELRFVVNDGYIYQVDGDKVSIKDKKSDKALNIGLSDVIKTDGIEDDNQITVLEDITQIEPLDNGLKAVVKKGHGLSITDEKGKELYTITEANGLCTNNVSYIAYDGYGLLWGATDDGVFSLAIPSAYSRFTHYEGVVGEAMSIEEYQGRKYIGTNHGLFRMEGKTFKPVADIIYACWDLAVTKSGLLAATANGIYRISADGSVKQLSATTSMALLDLGDQYYSGEMDGVYLINVADNSRKKQCGLEKVSKIIKDSQGTIWLQNMYGEVWNRKASAKDFAPHHKGQTEQTIETIVPLAGQVQIVKAEATTPFPYPLFSICDNNNYTWLTNNEGKQLYRWKDGKRADDALTQMIRPFWDTPIRAMLVKDNEIWFGSDDGFTVIDKNVNDVALNTKPQLFIRSITLGSDSILWSGYGKAPSSLETLDNDERSLRFTYSLDHEPAIGKTLYRYQLNDGGWSAWADDHDAEFLNLPYGWFTFKVQARDPFGRETEITTIKFRILFPFFLRWYMLVIYLILLGILIYIIIKIRLRRLEKDKIRLEKVVQERTAEVVKQKDEIEEKSKSLEKALDDLNAAQNELIRQEKMATAGKLTQGLIDRILNPLNYINNFTKLSEGLAKDVIANIEDEKENMDPDNYEDTMDVLDMLIGNLKKVGEHGQNNTRILKAMEEMLKDRSRGIVTMDLVPVLKQDHEMLQSYFAENIKKYSIHTTFDIPQEAITINGNPEQLSMTMMSLLGNSIYAVSKKAQRQQYQAEVKLTVKKVDNQYLLTVYDNGIGIEETIINKIFDPFFTTKPTGEASGVGLYISREIIQNIGGDISVRSVKNEYSEFTITIPALTA